MVPVCFFVSVGVFSFTCVFVSGCVGVGGCVLPLPVCVCYVLKFHNNLPYNIIVVMTLIISTYVAVCCPA